VYIVKDMNFPMIEIRVFTHPTCTTCPAAIQMVQRVVERDPQLRMTLISLATEKGREIARSLNVLSLPTILVHQTRFVGVPKWEELLEAIEQAKEELKVSYAYDDGKLESR
jgi:alkyl hydroperoxide reductase subunit AhpF